MKMAPAVNRSLALCIAMLGYSMLVTSSRAGDQDEPATSKSVYADRNDHYDVRVKIRARNTNSPKLTLPVRAFKIIDPSSGSGFPQIQEVSPGSIGADSTVKIPKGKRFGAFKFKPKNVSNTSVMFMIYDAAGSVAGYTVVAVKPKPGDAETTAGANTPIGVGRH